MTIPIMINAVWHTLTAAAHRMLTDLDRCMHGRHEGDRCFDCPGGASNGNPHIREGHVVGYSIDGKPYVMPPRGQRHKAAAWLDERAPMNEGLDGKVFYESLSMVHAALPEHLRDEFLATVRRAATWRTDVIQPALRTWEKDHGYRSDGRVTKAKNE